MSVPEDPDEPVVDDGTGRFVFAASASGAASEEDDRPGETQMYAVLVVDPQTGEVDVYGPLDGPAAVADAARRREEHDRADLEDVLIQVARLQSPTDLHRRA